ncbi:MAG: aminoglycoside phosphotransferase [Bacteroidetes bacterium]|nr:aminoglycoside phosphotransferase [Bacteroidota bacterium]
MIQLPNETLTDDTLRALSSYQSEIDNQPDYERQVAEAKRIWPHRKQNQPFREVKAKLAKMCSGAKRCCYCEDSMADEIEHIWPKDFFPERTFVWENYLFACGPCNGPKSNRFAIFTNQTSSFVIIDNKQFSKAPPPPGDSVLIDPRLEDPMDYLWLDIIDSFAFTPISDDPTDAAYHRGEYTIDVLKLNSRDDLVAARRNAYGNFRARLREYANQKANGTAPAGLNQLKNNIHSEHHPTVWREMVRQQKSIPELKAIFEQIPEAKGW